MMSARGDSFEEHKPLISDADVMASAKAGHIVSSWNSKPVMGDETHIKSLAVKFAFTGADSKTLLFDRYSLVVLRMLLETLEKADWRATQVAPRGKKLN